MQTSVEQKVIAAVIKKDGKFLIAQRAKEDPLKGKWEFPGGKLEKGETFHECLARELFEELGITATIGEYICSSKFSYKGKPMEMLAFVVTSYEGEIQLKEHSAITWINIDEFENYPFPDPDLPIIKHLIQNTDIFNQ
ncbi:MAG: (deoxy)nucleoside triphosphate pyrophosphohydrolase [Candidatus Babeliales bacterium]